jgi:ribosomal protein S18 acetylase RimI-like enzyme
MELRYATIEDADKLCWFARQAFYDSYAWYNDEQDMAAYANEAFTIARTEEDINTPLTKLLLAWNNDELCGFAKLTWGNRLDAPDTTEKQLEIARLYVAKQFIGKGVGKLLMEASIDYARQGSADCIWLEVWQENKRAIQFYTKWGFEIVSDWTFILGKDKQEDYIMVKQLNNS